MNGQVSTSASRPWVLAIVAALLLVVLLARGSRVPTPAAGILAAVLVLISCTMILRASIKAGSFLNGNTFVLVAFLMAYPVSGFVHLTGTDYVSQGFYDLAKLDPRTQSHHVYLSLALVFLAQIGLWYGLKPTRARTQSAGLPVFRIHSGLLVVFGFVFTLLGAVSTFLLFSGQGGSIDEMLTVDRSRELETGTARFAFMSAWLSWGIIFALGAFLVSRTSGKHRRLTLLALLAGSACMLLNMLWTGGRAENLLALMPLVFVVRKFAPRVFRPYIFTMALGVTGVIAFETAARTSALLVVGSEYLARAGISTSQFVTNQLVAVLDWEMGRFSTIALSFDMVRNTGYGFGSTLLQGAAITLNAPATLLHIPLKIYEPEAITSLVGQYLFSDPTINGVVPGTLAELYFNFGICGVFCGFFVIGRIAKYCIDVTRSADRMGSALLGFYSLVLLCLWTIPMTATLTLYFLATRGLPILAFFVAERTLVYRRRRVPQNGLGLSGPRFSVTT
jgi:hypothetical protein